MLETLNELDQQLFIFLNGLHTPFLDPVMYWITNKYTWFPFYGILAIYLMWRYKKYSWLILLGLLVCVAGTDQLTSAFMKPYFGRPRPCHNIKLAEFVHMVVGCGGKFGFASGHAANSFGMAMYLYLILHHLFRYSWLLFVWAAFVAYSRIYVGVHYPGDIITGAVVGMVIGWFCFWLANLISRRMYNSSLKEI